MYAPKEENQVTVEEREKRSQSVLVCIADRERRNVALTSELVIFKSSIV
jgi:hypothetical protein